MGPQHRMIECPKPEGQADSGLKCLVAIFREKWGLGWSNRLHKCGNNGPPHCKRRSAEIACPEPMRLGCLVCCGAGDSEAAVPLYCLSVLTLCAVKREEGGPRRSDRGNSADQSHGLSAEGARQCRVIAHAPRYKQHPPRGTSGKLRSALVFSSVMQLRHTTPR
jgi:hypothetical protein